jgi:hypothetical protein
MYVDDDSQIMKSVAITKEEKEQESLEQIIDRYSDEEEKVEAEAEAQD